MKNGTTKLVTTLTFAFAIGQPAWAQAGQGASNLLIYGLLALAVLIFFALLVQVSDNLLAIEAKQLGADKSGGNFSLFPNWNELFPRRLPSYVDEQPVTVLKKGFDILLEGEAEKRIEPQFRARTFAVQPPNFFGISPIPKLEVEVGDQVKAGDPLFFDKNHPDIKYCAPMSGEVIAINRGDKRAIVEVVILADKEIKYRELPALDLEGASREDLVKFLLESGAWPLIRQRPFNIVAEQGEAPRDIFISTFDSAPLAPDLNFVVEGREAAFQRGLDALAKLSGGKVYLGLNARPETPPHAAFTEAKGVEKRWFHGRHPSGNVGVQIHHIDPIRIGDKIWTLGVQEVITIGALFTERRFNVERVVAITGGELKKTAYARTHAGANVGDLIGDNLAQDHVRIISGDPLTGHKKTKEGYLDIFDDQITVIQEGDYYEMFGWLLPLTPRPSISRTFPNFLFPDLRFRADTNTHGEKRAFVMTGQYESVLPMDIYIQHLMKSIMIGDYERMEGLGIYELVEEDVALCEFVCTSKQPLQQVLRKGLNMIRDQS
jgi:Na+-transporting NADH:ubiquinone oxidoreductase subunit A